MTTPSENSSETSSETSSPNLGGKLRNALVAFTAIALTVLVFFGLRAQKAVPTLASLAERAIPLEQAVGNGKPTVIEFYADWCTSCQAMASTVAQGEQDYGDRINFVMLNVDNDKWLPEVLAYRVDGIPHFEFLNAQAEAVGNSLGEQPPTMFAANLDALINRQPLPYASNRGQVSALEPDFSPSPSADDPRSHGAQVQKS